MKSKKSETAEISYVDINFCIFTIEATFPEKEINFYQFLSANVKQGTRFVKCIFFNPRKSFQKCL